MSRDLPTNVDAVMTYNEFYKTYFFKGDMVWRFDEGTKTVDVNWPYPIAEIFPGIPANLDAAFRYKDGKFCLYMVYQKNDTFIKYCLSILDRNCTSNKL